MKLVSAPPVIGVDEESSSEYFKRISTLEKLVDDRSKDIQSLKKALSTLENEKLSIACHYEEEKCKHASTMDDVRVLGKMNAKAVNALEKVTAVFLQNSETEKSALEAALRAEANSYKIDASKPHRQPSSTIENNLENERPLLSDVQQVAKSPVRVKQGGGLLSTKKPESVDSILDIADMTVLQKRVDSVSSKQKRVIDDISGNYTDISEPTLNIAQRLVGSSR